MINRLNYHDVKMFLRYCEVALQNDPKTVLKRRGCLRHALEWANEVPFPKARTIDPTFPVYLNKARADGKSKPLAPATLAKICESARLFFQWAHGEYPAKYKAITESWITTLRPGRAKGIQSRLKTHIFYTVEDALRIAQMEVTTLREKRDRAAFAFLFLSGMRADAFVSLPPHCVDLATLQIRQLPEFGVRTKNHKAAITTLLNIPELLTVVREWDELIRESGAARGVWYAHIDRDGVNFGQNQAPGEGRRIILSRGIKRICDKAGVKYLSPHKLRHGHAVYALGQAKNMAEYKAVSQNLMHADISITDGLYSVLQEDAVREKIAGLGSTGQAIDANHQVQAFLKLLQDNPGLFTRPS